MRVDNLLCLITGPSGSGKTSIALDLQKRLSVMWTAAATRNEENNEGDVSSRPGSSPNNPDSKQPASVVVIHQDHYFTKPFLPYEDREDDSYENGSGINWDGLVADVQLQFEEASGKTIGRGSDDGNPNRNGYSGVKIVIVEGHLLGDAAAMFRQKLSSYEHAGVVAVLLSGCPKETCKQRRLDRKKNRREDERKELTKYIDVFVWPSFLNHGVHSMDALRREIVGMASSATTNSTIQDDPDTELLQHLVTEANKSVAVVLDVDNSDGASLKANVDEILNRIHNIILG